MNLPKLAELRAAGAIGPLDVHLARTLGRLGSEARPEVQLAVALLSQQVQQGEVCLDLTHMVTPAIPERSLPDADAWGASLAESSLVGEGEAATPLVLNGSRLYLRRYWQYEQLVAMAVRSRLAAAEPSDEAERAWLRGRLDLLFATPAETPDWQRVAVVTALRRRFCVLSGGPGTGKTTTVARLLALLVEQALRRGERPPRFDLVAPTGKAAARLAESIRGAVDVLPCDDQVRAAVPQSASTIHRRLGMSRDGTRFTFHADHPLPVDGLLVDEASMVDLALMAHLVEALPPRARLILLGDRDQLASVDAGAVLGEICAAAVGPISRGQVAELIEVVPGLPTPAEVTDQAGIADCVVQLQHSYRYGADSGIAALARAVNAGDAALALDLLADSARPDVTLVDPGAVELADWLREPVLAGLAGYLSTADPAAALRGLGALRVLCVVRQGGRGVGSLNRVVESLLAADGSLDPRGALYPHRPVMVTRNDYALRLFNGDLGCLLPDPQRDGRLAAFFATEGSGEAVRAVSPARLPDHQTVFAMTVHKSQGSEVDDVLLVLPEKPSAVLTRELIYTAVTRARGRVGVFGAADVLAHGIGLRTERPSGLRGALLG